MGGLVDVDALFLVGEVEGEFEAGAGLVEEAEFMQVILVAALFPAADIVVGEMFTDFTQLLADGAVGEAVVEHLVDLVADGFRETSDVAAAAARAARTAGLVD